VAEERVIDQVQTDRFTMIHADCVPVVAALPPRSVGYSIYSVPFSSLYTYSNNTRDMGNCRGDEQFFEHMAHLTGPLLRATVPGRLTSIHCMDLPTSKERDGHIGLRDFPGDLIRAYEAAGWIYHSRVTIWKDPVTAMQRTKALGLLHKTLRENASMSRQGIADYLVTMRAPCAEIPHEDRVKHVAGTETELPVELWQRYASPVWMDIKPNETLQGESAREHDDERHICPLQLEVIRRGVQLWTNPGDVVLSPFAGIGSEGFVALEEGRRFVGVELKRSYYEQAVRNLQRAANEEQEQLFA
jgi:hypothetical protein